MTEQQMLAPPLAHRLLQTLDCLTPRVLRPSGCSRCWGRFESGKEVERAHLGALGQGGGWEEDCILELSKGLCVPCLVCVGGVGRGSLALGCSKGVFGQLSLSFPI